jgi:hypothetical protein
VEQKRRSRTLFGYVVVLRPEALSEACPEGGGAAGEEERAWEYTFFGNFLFD